MPMLTKLERIKSFSLLGDVLKKYLDEKEIDFSYKELIDNAVKQAEIYNTWFTKDNVHIMLKTIANYLDEQKLEFWLNKYLISENETPFTVAVVMAGNIPLVGFHDFLCILLSGNKILCKMSSEDKILLPALCEILFSYNPEWKNFIEFTEEHLKKFDAVIATGSNNTSRYFDYYFSSYPNIIRKNRNSIAVLSGNESAEELEKLSDDIFLYFGLGCRSVSKLYVPKTYQFQSLINATSKYRSYLFHNKLLNNYDYNKAIYMINQIPFIDGGFFLLRNDNALLSPISCLYYEYYDNIEDVNKTIFNLSEQLQCVVAYNGFSNDSVSYGNSQFPFIEDYSDNIDTMRFLTSLKKL